MKLSDGERFNVHLMHFDTAMNIIKLSFRIKGFRFSEFFRLVNVYSLNGERFDFHLMHLDIAMNLIK